MFLIEASLEFQPLVLRRQNLTEFTSSRDGDGDPTYKRCCKNKIDTVQYNFEIPKGMNIYIVFYFIIIGKGGASMRWKKYLYEVS